MGEHCVMPAAPDFSWIPDHQLHAAFTLAHVDDLTDRCWQALEPYQRDGIVKLRDKPVAGRTHVVVTDIPPLPSAIVLYAADALTQLRAALEHTLYAEIEATLGRSLSADEARAVEIPAFDEEKKFDTWLKHKHRRTLDPLQEGALAGRIRELQPFNRGKTAEHPLRVLVEHTNLAKHRMPAVAAVHLGHVQPHHSLPDVRFPDVAGRPVQVDDVIVDAPEGTRLVLDVWPKVSIRRPHTGEWKVLMQELGNLSWWVRCIAVPVLIAGRHDVAPLPPQLDTFAAHRDVRPALASAGSASAAERSLVVIKAAVAREGLQEALALHESKPAPSTIRSWVKALKDEEVLARVGLLRPGHSAANIMSNAAVIESWLAECQASDGGGE